MNDIAFTEWFMQRWPTGWHAAQAMSLGDVIRESFEAGYTARANTVTKDTCRTSLTVRCKVTAE